MRIVSADERVTDCLRACFPLTNDDHKENQAFVDAKNCKNLVLQWIENY